MILVIYWSRYIEDSKENFIISESNIFELGEIYPHKMFFETKYEYMEKVWKIIDMRSNPPMEKFPENYINEFRSYKKNYFWE